MSTNVSKQTQLQNDLLGRFIRAWENIAQSVSAAAIEYHACVQARIDMSRWVCPKKDKVLHEKLTLLGSGKLPALSMARLTATPLSHMRVLATFNSNEQQRLMADGITVRRGMKDVVVPFFELSTGEVKAAVDVLNGRGRVVAPEEQTQRLLPPRASRDKMLAIRFTSTEWNNLQARAKKQGKSVHGIVWVALQEYGLI